MTPCRSARCWTKWKAPWPLTGDGAYDQDSVYRAVTERDPDAVVVVPPRATAVLSETAETEPTQHDGTAW